MDAFATAVEILKTGGPWGLTVFIAFAYWQKDKQCRELTLRLVTMVEGNAIANTKVEAAVNGLKEFITAFISKPNS